jgi:hypothetical protein
MFQALLYVYIPFPHQLVSDCSVYNFIWKLKDVHIV